MVKLIAEFCQNHNGDFNLLAKMVEKASLSGASYGKMQNIPFLIGLNLNMG